MARFSVIQGSFQNDAFIVWRSSRAQTQGEIFNQEKCRLICHTEMPRAASSLACNSDWRNTFDSQSDILPAFEDGYSAL